MYGNFPAQQKNNGHYAHRFAAGIRLESFNNVQGKAVSEGEVELLGFCNAELNKRDATNPSDPVCHDWEQWQVKFTNGEIKKRWFKVSIENLQKIGEIQVEKLITLNNLKANVRTISFQGNDDPYVLAHSDRDMLDNSTIYDFYNEWKMRSLGGADPRDNEEFEKFIVYLENLYGYFGLPTAYEALSLG